MGNYTEFNRVYRLIADGRTDFDSNINVSVFETNIRIVGGLLSAHLLAHRGEKYLGCLSSVKSFSCKFKIGNFKSTCVSYPLLFALIEHGKYVFSIIIMLKGCRKCFFLQWANHWNILLFCWTFTAGVELEPGWPCSGPLLRLAEDVATRLLPAFDTPTGSTKSSSSFKKLLLKLTLIERQVFRMSCSTIYERHFL